jgi:hypothetical protein
MNFTEYERDGMSMSLDGATRGKHWKDEIDVLFSGSAGCAARRLVRSIVYFRGQVADVTCPTGQATFRAVGTFSGFRVTAPACFDGCAGEGYASAESDYVLAWSGWQGSTGHTFSVEDIMAAAEPQPA